MQKLTITFIYKDDEERRLKYRVTDDMPLGVMLEKLIGFQFIIDSADPTTFRVMHNGEEFGDLSKTFEHYSVADGDEIHLMPTVFEPIPPLPENDMPIKRPHTEKKAPRHRQLSDDITDSPKKEPMRKPNNFGNQRKRRPTHTNNTQQNSEKGAPRSQEASKQDAPVPFKPRNKNGYYRSHKKSSGTGNNKPQA